MYVVKSGKLSVDDGSNCRLVLVRSRTASPIARMGRRQTPNRLPTSLMSKVAVPSGKKPAGKPEITFPAGRHGRTGASC